MTSIAVWLLISVGGRTITTIERFPDYDECRRIRQAIISTWGGSSDQLICVSAKVVKS